MLSAVYKQVGYCPVCKKATAALGFSALIACLCPPLQAQDCRFTVQGRILEAGALTPIADAAIRIEENGVGALSDAEGRFRIGGLCEGRVYTLRINHIGHAPQWKTVRTESKTSLEVLLANENILEEIVVSGRASVLPPVQSASAVSVKDFEATQGLNLGEVVKRLPGVSTLNTGATIAKPVVQGLHSNRVAIVSDNIVLEGQQWGAEHAPEIDPFNAGSVKVVKGAAGVRYGVGALAGAVVLEPAPLREAAGWGGWLTAGGYTNGRSGLASGAVDWRLPNRQWAFRLQGTVKRSGNLRAPDYWLHNTGMAENNLSLTADWKYKQLQHNFSATRFSQRLGILRSAHVGSTSDLQKAIESATPLNNTDAFTYAMDRPFQAVEHYSLRYKNVWRVSDVWRLNTQYSYQFNHRREYDVVRRSGAAADKPQARFRLWTNRLDAALEHLPIRHWQGGVGAQGLYQVNYVGSGGYIPDYYTSGVSLWATERYRRFPDPWEAEIGLRYDYRQSKATYSEGTFLPPGQARVQNIAFGNISGSTGLSYWFNEYIKVSLHSGLAWRPPHIYELFARGVHFATATYEEGNPNMRSEKAWNSNLNFVWEGLRNNLTLTLYRNAVRDFIYVEPSLDSVLTVRGAFPVFRYRQDDAVLKGVDLGGDIAIKGRWSAEGKVSIVRGERKIAPAPGDKESTRREWLPLMPVDRFQYGLKWQTGKSISGKETFIRAYATSALRQKRYPEGTLRKAPPPGFTLIGIDASHTFPLKKERSIELSVNAQNLGNVRYREYLNFFRFFADEPGANVGLRAKIIF